MADEVTEQVDNMTKHMGSLEARVGELERERAERDKENLFRGEMIEQFKRVAGALEALTLKQD